MGGGVDAALGVVGGGWKVGVSGWGWWWLGVPLHMCTCMCMHIYTHTHTYVCGKHDNFMQMAVSIGIFRDSLVIPYDVICMCTYICVHACTCICMCVEGFLSPPPIHPASTPQRGTPRISKNSKVLELIEIFQFCLNIWNQWRLPHPSVGV